MLTLNPRYAGPARNDLGSGAIWHDLPGDIDSPANGYHDFTDFSELPKHASTGSGAVTAQQDRWHAFLAQGGFYRNPATGVANAALELGSDGDNENVTLISRGKALIASAAPAAWFEAEIAASLVTSAKPGIVVGLTGFDVAAAAVLLTTSDALADRDFVGFHWLEATGALQFTWKAAGQTAQVGIASLPAPGANEFVRLGFKLQPKAKAAERLAVFVNGVKQGTHITAAQLDAATFPKAVNLGFGVTVNNCTGTNPGTGFIKWMRAAQRIVGF